MSDLVKEGLLDIDVIFLVEGEEESGSIGFANAAMQHKVKYHNEFSIRLYLVLTVPIGTFPRHRHDSSK